MDDFGHSLQSGRDWPLFDRVTEACRSVQRPTLVTSEDTDLSDEAERATPARHKRRGRVSVRGSHQAPAKGSPGGWRATGGELGEPVPAWGVRFSPGSACSLYPSEEVWSGSEEELELEMVNQFLMARGQALPRDDAPRSPQVILISGTQVHSSKSQCPTVPTSGSMRCALASVSRPHQPVCQSHAASASVGPSAAVGTEGYVGDDLHSDAHLRGGKREVPDPGFKHAPDAQGPGEGEDTLQESQEGTRKQSQPSEAIQHSAELFVEGLCRSALGELMVTPTLVSDSNDGQFAITSEPTTGAGSMPEGSAEDGESETGYSISVPEVYEYFYMDYGEQPGRGPLSSRVPSEPAGQGRKRRRETDFLRALKIFASKRLPASWQAHSAVVPTGVPSTSAMATFNAHPDLSPLDGALVNYSPADGSQTALEGCGRKGRGGVCRSCIQNNLCLFCFACASWALKSATSNSDMWKAALLVNVSAIYTVRYFRRHVQREDSNIGALPDT